MKTFSINKEFDEELALKTEKLLSYKVNQNENVANLRADKRNDWLYEAFISLYKDNLKMKPIETKDVDIGRYASTREKYNNMKTNTKEVSLLTQDEMDDNYIQGITLDMIDSGMDSPEVSYLKTETAEEMQQFKVKIFKEKGVYLSRLLELVSENNELARIKFWRIVEEYGLEEELSNILEIYRKNR